MKQEPQKEEKESESTAGFQRFIRSKGKAEVDPLFEERLLKNKNEINKFYQKYPELREKYYED